MQPVSVAFARWTADDALHALSRAGVRIDHAEPAHWPARAPQPRTHREALAVYSPGLADPHLILAFDTPEALATWQLWLARYWKARPYLSVKDNVLLLVSRELSPERAAAYHAALARLGA
jgi:hypothetical protein